MQDGVGRGLSSPSSPSLDAHWPRFAAWPAHAQCAPLLIPLPIPLRTPRSTPAGDKDGTTRLDNHQKKFCPPLRVESSHARAPRCNKPPIRTSAYPSEGAECPRMGPAAPMHHAALPHEPSGLDVVRTSVHVGIGLDVIAHRSTHCSGQSAEGSHRCLCLRRRQQL